MLEIALSNQGEAIEELMAEAGITASVEMAGCNNGADVVIFEQEYCTKMTFHVCSLNDEPTDEELQRRFVNAANIFCEAVNLTNERKFIIDMSTIAQKIEGM